MAAASDGTEVARIPAPKPLAQAQARLRAQRRAARQAGPDRRSGQRPSKRWSKTAARIGRVHTRAADIRRDVLHKATTQLAQRCQVIVAEDLAVANMTRDLNAATNLARLSEHTPRVEGRPAGSGPVAGRGADRKTRAAAAVTAGGCETSTPHSRRPAAGKTGTAPPRGEAA